VRQVKFHFVPSNWHLITVGLRDCTTHMASLIWSKCNPKDWVSTWNMSSKSFQISIHLLIIKRFFCQKNCLKVLANVGVQCHLCQWGHIEKCGLSAFCLSLFNIKKSLAVNFDPWRIEVKSFIKGEVKFCKKNWSCFFVCLYSVQTIKPHQL